MFMLSTSIVQLSMQAAAAELGLAFAKFDKNMGNQYDALTATGVIMIAEMILRIKEGGLFVLGPPCSLWVFFSSSVHQRTKHNIHGNIHNPLIRRSNHLARVVAGLIRLAVHRKVHFIIEQPVDSQLFSFPAIARTMKKAQPHSSDI